MTNKNCCPALRMFSKSPMKYFKSFGSGFTELHAELDADTFLDLSSIADKIKHEVQKAIV
jgi:hypothetical protein